MHDGYVYETGVPYPYDFEAPYFPPKPQKPKRPLKRFGDM